MRRAPDWYAVAQARRRRLWSGWLLLLMPLSVLIVAAVLRSLGWEG